MQEKKPASVILHNIRSVHNVGSVFRTADAVGIERIYLTGYTPRPIDRFGREEKSLTKVALGAEKTVAWEYHRSVGALLRKLKHEQVHLVAVEQDPKAVAYTEVKVSYPAAFLFGNEVRGISQPLLNLCDEIAYIPMRGEKESLNVSVAAGVFLFQVLTASR